MLRLKSFRKWVAWVLAIICTISVNTDFSLVANAQGIPVGSSVYMIKSSFVADAYLYEVEGKVFYGKPIDIGDLSYYWEIELNADGLGHDRIKNVATGHYMNYKDEENFNDPIECLEIGDTTNALFEINSLVDGKQNIISSTNPNLVVHIEQAYGHAQCSNWAQASWGTAQWLFEKPDDFVFRIKNSSVANTYLYEADGEVLYGTPVSLSDMSYYWVVEPDADGLGNAKIKNVVTGHYMNYQDQTDFNDAIQCVEANAITNALFDIKGINDNGIVKQNIVASTNANLVVHIEQAYGHAQCSNWAQASWGTAQWLFEDPEDNVFRIKNSSTANTYLYEAEGDVLYGTPANTTDLTYHWSIEPDANGFGKSRIKNVSTGHYMNYVDAENFNDPIECLDSSEVTNDLFNINSMVEDTFVRQNIIASTNANLVVHIEQAYGHAQCSNWAQASWGTAKWLFENPADITDPEEPEEPAEDVAGLVIKIKNAYVADTYLYEKEGKVLYGKADSVFDLNYYWVVESDVDGLGNARIRNIGTGHYMNYENQSNFNDAIRCVDIREATNVLFDINTIGEGAEATQNIIAKTDESLIVHVEQALGHAQCSNWAQASWGTAKWIFEDPSDKTPQGVAFKIQNAYTTTEADEPVFLCEEAGEVVYGPLVDVSDLSYYWYFDVDDTGKYTIKNWKTGHFIMYQNIENNNTKMECVDYSVMDQSGDTNILFTINNIDDNGTIKHNIIGANESIRMHTEGFAFPVCSNWAQNFFGSAQWIFTDPIRVAPTEVLTPNGHTRIKNDWSGQYLYEVDGKVKYGLPVGHDPNSHWDIIDKEGHQLIKNVATGHYFNYVNQTDYNEPIACVDLSEAAFPFLDVHEVIDGDVTKYTIVASTNSNLVVHVQQQTGSVQCSNWAQAAWGSAKWLFEPASDDVVGAVKVEIPESEDPTAVLNDGDIIRFKNSWREMYLYQAEDGKVAYGNVATADLSSHWIVEIAGHDVRLKNRASEQYMSVENGLGYVECLGLEDATQWEVVTAPNQVSGMKVIRAASHSDLEASGESSYYLHTEGDKGYVEDGQIPPSWGSPQWIITRVSQEDSSTGFVRLKNKATGNYLYEENAQVSFGANSDVAVDDAKSHWVIERTLRYTRIKNRATGNYINVEGMMGLVDPLKSSSDNSLNGVWIMKEESDGYFTFENMNKEGWLIHNLGAITTTFAQCSEVSEAAGTSQWALEEAPTVIARTLPTEFVKIKSKSGNMYLYENKSGAVLYGNLDDENTAYHWKLEVDGDNYKVVNKYSGHYLSIENNASFLQCTEDANDSETAEWSVDVAPVSDYSILSNVAAPNQFVNINNAFGFAQTGILSNEKSTAQWNFVTAPVDAENPEYVADQTDTSTFSIVSSNQYLAIKNKLTGQYVSDHAGTLELVDTALTADSQWMEEDYLGYKRLKNKDTGNYLEIGGGGEPNAQWIIEDALGYKRIENVSLEQYLGTEEEALICKPLDNNSDMLWTFEPVVADTVYEAEKAFLAGNAVAIGTSVTGFSEIGDKAVFTVNASVAGNYNVVLSYANVASMNAKLAIYVNGVKNADKLLTPTTVNTWSTMTAALPLHAGINTISYQAVNYEDSKLVLDAITVENTINNAYKGATLPYLTYEAEDALTNASLIGPDVKYYTFASEASGRKALELESASDYMAFELAEDANAMVIRYLLPDAVAGGGTTQTVGLYVNGEKLQDIVLSSKNSWVYGSYPWSNDPSQGKPHRYYDETRVVLGSTLPAGTLVKLQKDNAAQYCIIDLVDMESVEAAYAMPVGFLSITDFGAIANDGVDDTIAMNTCISTASAQGKGVWLPAGTFNFNNGSRGVTGVNDTRIQVLGEVTIKGAGVWHTTLAGPFAGFMVKGSNVGFYDFTIEGDEVTREDAHGTTGIESDYNTPGMKNLTIQNIWFNHVKTGVWLHNMNNAHIVGSRVRNTYADGLHLSKGTINSIIEQNQVRNTGDDGIAMWSQELADVNNTIRFNTVELPWLANNIAIYGGKNNKIQDNIIKDTIAFGSGINISSNFNPIPFSGSVIVERNTLVRAGGHEYNFNVDYGAIRIDTTINIDAKIVFSNNNIYDSSYQGISIHGPNTIGNLVFQNTVIDGTGTWGVNAVSGSKGFAAFKNIIYRNTGIENEYNVTGTNGMQFVKPDSWNYYDTFSPTWTQSSSLDATNVGQNTLRLDWDPANSSIGVDEYIVSWAGHVKHVPSNVTTLQVTGLYATTSYDFNVIARDHFGNQSQEVLSTSATTTHATAGVSQPPAVTQTNTTIGVVKDGKLIYTFTDEQLDKKLEGKSIVFEVDSTKGEVVVQLPLQAMIDATKTNADTVITIQADHASYDLPMNIFDIIKRDLGSNFNSKDASLEITMQTVSQESLESINKKASDLGITLVSDAIDFSISVVVAGKSTVVSDFGSHYISRSIIVNGNIDTDTATVVLYDPVTGTMEFVPAVFEVVNGKTIVKIKNNSNSIYMVVKNIKTFTDITNHWAHKDIQILVDKGLINGVSTDLFAPNRDITRAEFTSILVRSLRLKGDDQKNSFKDVAETVWYAQAVDAAVDSGLISGFGDGSFRPNDSITREQMALMMVKALEIVKGPSLIKSNSPVLSQFMDAKDISDWAKEGIGTSVEYNLIKGNGYQLAPKDNATRAEAMVMLRRLLEKILFI